MERFLINLKTNNPIKRFFDKKIEEGEINVVMMFIIIAIGVAILGIAYAYITGTVIPKIEGNLDTTVDGWFTT